MADLIYHKGILNRTVTQKECFWLDNDMTKDTIIYRYHKHTYGCIRFGGIAVSMQVDEDPFFELPIDSIDWHQQ